MYQEHTAGHNSERFRYFWFAFFIHIDAESLRSDEFIDERWDHFHCEVAHRQTEGDVD